MNNQHPADDFSLYVAGGPLRRLVTGWLLLAVGSLVVGGLFTILIVLSRTPGIQDVFPLVDFFHTALVVHVDLTVLVWFLAFAGVLWSINSTEQFIAAGWGALLLAIGGAAVISIAPFLGAGEPLMNNYVPVLRDSVFFYGLGIFGLGFAILVLRGLLCSLPINKNMSGEGALSFGLYTGLLAALITILALIWSYYAIPEEIQGESYYEALFWGSGHVLQITHTQLMLAVWLWLANASGMVPQLSPRVVVVFFTLGFIPALLTPVIFFSYDITSPAQSAAFITLMKYGGGLAALPLGLAVVLGAVKALRSNPGYSPLRGALLFSILLFGVGGVIGFMISTSNVTVPAHYHGAIVAVTLSYMGLTYHLLPRLGFRNPVGRMVNWQPIVYGGGQLLHVLGLTWSGGYGVQRKTAGAAQGLDSIQEVIGMGIMGLGGLIAVVGGVMYLVVVFMSMRPER